MEERLTLHLSGERVPADLYRDLMSGREVALAAEGPLPAGKEGTATVYVHLDPLSRIQSAAREAAENLAGTCGRTLVRDTDKEGRIHLRVMEPAGGKPAPCSKCRANCPGRQTIELPENIT